MKILGNSRGVATVIAVAIGLAVAPAAAQIAPTAGPVQTPPPPKPATATATPAKPVPAAAKPSAPPAGTAPSTTAAAAKTPAAKPADAKALFAAGEKKFKANDFAGALTDFEASETAKSAPETQRYIGLTQDNLQHYPEAVAAFEKFIASAPAKSKDQVDEATKRVTAIKAMPGKVHIESVPAGASVLVDPPAQAAAPAAASTAPTAPGAPPPPPPAAATAPTGPTAPTDIELPPGKHSLRLTADGYETADKDIDVTFASKQDVRIELVKKPEPPPPPPPPPVVAEATPPASATPPAPPPEPRSKVPAYVTGAVAIVAAGVGTGFGIKALSQSNDFDKNPTTKLADDGENNALIADMMFGIAITFGVTSAVLFLSSDQPATTAKAVPTKVVAKKSSVTVTPTPYVTQHGGGAGLNVRF